MEDVDQQWGLQNKTSLCRGRTGEVPSTGVDRNAWENKIFCRKACGGVMREEHQACILSEYVITVGCAAVRSATKC